MRDRAHAAPTTPAHSGAIPDGTVAAPLARPRKGRKPIRALRLLGRRITDEGRRRLPVVDLLLDPHRFRIESFRVAVDHGTRPLDIPADEVETGLRGSHGLWRRPGPPRLLPGESSDGPHGAPEAPPVDGSPEEASRRLSLLAGAPIISPDGRSGVLEDAIIEDGGWRVLHFVVRLSPRFDRRRVLLLPNWVRRIEPAARGIRVALPSERVEECPRYPSPHGIDPEYVLQLQGILSPFRHWRGRGERRKFERPSELSRRPVLG